MQKGNEHENHKDTTYFPTILFYQATGCKQRL